MTIHLLLAEHGRTFATRGRAMELRERLSKGLTPGEQVIVDFTGVTNVTYSFADELVGKLAAETDGRVEPINMDPLVASTVASAVERRTRVSTSC